MEMYERCAQKVKWNICIYYNMQFYALIFYLFQVWFSGASFVLDHFIITAHCIHLFEIIRIIREFFKSIRIINSNYSNYLRIVKINWKYSNYTRIVPINPNYSNHPRIVSINLNYWFELSTTCSNQPELLIRIFHEFFQSIWINYSNYSNYPQIV